MSESGAVGTIISTLRAARANLSCDEMARLLKSLGFEVRDGKKPGHKIFVHQGLEGFFSSSYTCGHGRNLTIDSAYVSNVIRVLTQNESELLKYLRRAK